MENIIGQRIKERRKELKITQTKIQQETSISSGNLSSIENGKYLPSAIALLELSKILNCSVDWILTGESSKSEISINNNDRMLLDYFHNMSAADQEELLMIAEMKFVKEKKRLDAKLSTSQADDMLA